MGISHGDQLFVYYNANELPVHGRYSYFGNDFGSVFGFRQYIDGYIYAVEALFREYNSCDGHRIDILDTLVYPLCFNYRQIVELNIKCLFFKYANVDDATKEAFVRNVSHRLNRAWYETKPYIQKLLTKIGNPIDMLLLDDFINQIDTFDSDSSRMRYPIKKDLQSVHTGSVKLDVIGLHHKMMSLFDYFRRLDNEIDNVLIENVCGDGFIDKMREQYSAARTSIVAVSEFLRYLATKNLEHRLDEGKDSGGIIDLSDIDIKPDPEQQRFEQMVLELPIQHAALLALLTHAGKAIVDRECRLSIDGEERKNDFFKLLEITLEECSAFIDCDGKYSCETMCYALLEKDVEVTSRWLAASIPLLESYMSPA